MSTGEEQTLPGVPIPQVDLGPIGPRTRYEFTPDQEQVIGDLAGKMRFVGGLLLLLSLFIVGQVIHMAARLGLFDVYGTLNAIVFGLLGYWTLSAAGGFSEVVRTVGWDVPHLMDALRSLRKMYALLYYLLAAALIASLVLLVTYRVR